jgi:hypothetical protein
VRNLGIVDVDFGTVHVRSLTTSIDTFLRNLGGVLRIVLCHFESLKARTACDW